MSESIDANRELGEAPLPVGVAVFTVEEAARALRIGRSAAYEAVRRGQIPALRLGRKVRIPRTGLEHLLFGGVGGNLASDQDGDLKEAVVEIESMP